MFLTSGTQVQRRFNRSEDEEPRPLLAAVSSFYMGGNDSLVRPL
jgi:hypothetical protein